MTTTLTVATSTDDSFMSSSTGAEEQLEVLQGILTQQLQQPQPPSSKIIPQQVLSFLQTYFYHHCTNSSHIAACPSFLAGMRQVLERQLDDESQPSVVWILDPVAVLMNSSSHSFLHYSNHNDEEDGSTQQQQQQQQQYMRDAVAALLSFLIFVPQPQLDNINHHNNKWTLAVQPQLSDRTLHRLLQVLPSPKELQARPTGTFVVAATAAAASSSSFPQLERTNVQGDQDEPMDVCAVALYNLKQQQQLRGWGRWCLGASYIK